MLNNNQIVFRMIFCFDLFRYLLTMSFLSKLDNLNVLNSQSGSGAAGMFEEVAIPSDMLDKVDEFKQKLEEIKAIADEIVILVADRNKKCKALK